MAIREWRKAKSEQRSGLERVFDADERRDLVAQPDRVQAHQHVHVQQERADDVQLDAKGGAQLVERPGAERDVGKLRSLPSSAWKVSRRRRGESIT